MSNTQPTYTTPEIITVLKWAADLAGAAAFAVSELPGTSQHAAEVAHALGSAAEAYYGLAKAIENGEAIPDTSAAVVASVMSVAYGVGGQFVGAELGMALLWRFAALAMTMTTFPAITPFAASVIVAGAVGFSVLATSHVFSSIGRELGKALSQLLKDPLVLDLDGDGVELISLADSNAHLDYGGDGFAERTGWVKGDARLLVFDRNGNGAVTPATRPGCTVGNRRATNKPGCRVGNRRARNKPGCAVGNRRANAKMRGFEVLETLDTNHDGKVVSFPAPLRHNAADTDFASLRVWQDANEDGACDAGDPKTLAELRRMQGRLLVGNRRPNQGCGHPKAQQRAIASISVNRTDVTGTNEGHDRGFAATFTRAHFPRAFSCPPATGAGSTGAAETITFQTDTADTVDPTPEFFRYDDLKFRHRTLLDQQIFVLKTIGARNGMGAKIRTGRVHCFYGAGR